MKILLINSVLGIGSTGRIVQSLYNFFKGEGHDVKVAYGRNRCEKVPEEEVDMTPEIRVHIQKKQPKN